MKGWLCWEVRKVRYPAQVGEVVGKEGKRRLGRLSVGDTAWEVECDDSALSRMEPKVQTGGSTTTPEVQTVYCTWRM